MRGGNGGAEVGVRVLIGEGAGQQDRIGDAVFVDQLLAEKIGIGTGRSDSLGTYRSDR